MVVVAQFEDDEGAEPPAVEDRMDMVSKGRRYRRGLLEAPDIGNSVE